MEGLTLLGFLLQPRKTAVFPRRRAEYLAEEMEERDCENPKSCRRLKPLPEDARAPNSSADIMISATIGASNRHRESAVRSRLRRCM